MILAIDYSLTCPSFCFHDVRLSDSWKIFYVSPRPKFIGSFFNGRITGLPYPIWKTPMERYLGLADAVMFQVAILSQKNRDNLQIFLEDYSMASKGRVFHIAENTAILKYLIHQNNYPVTTVPPTVLKKHATGKGNARKPDMGKIFFEKTGLDLAKTLGYTASKPMEDSPMSDIQDAYLLALYGLDKIANHSQLESL
jgi:hypothetical protein